MPGVHTFYDGSLILQPLSNAIGIEIDKLNLVLCMATSLPLAYVYYKPMARASETVRLLFPTIIGILFCWFCFGGATKHLLANILINYVLMHVSPDKYVHKVVFLFSMGYLTFIHFYRWKILDVYYIDITGPLMVSVQKVTTMAFSLHDGRVKKPEELTPLQKKEAIREVPHILNYLSYVLHFQAVLTGPLCFYTDYMLFVKGEHIEKNSKGEEPSPIPTAFSKLYLSMFFVLMVALVVPRFPVEALDDENSYKMNTILWMILFWITISMQRMQYYFAWYLADAIYNMSGFGFNGFDEEGEAKWDLATNVDAWRVETAQSFKECLDPWNCTTMGWLRRVAFDRAPKRYRTLSTYLLSAWWHGFFMGYYLTFLTGAIMTLGGKGFRRSLRWRFLGSPSLKLFYDVITFIGTKITLSYTTYPFTRMHYTPGMNMYKRVYFSWHIAAIFAAAVLPVILPPPKKTSEDAKKEDANGAHANGEIKKEL